MSDQLKGILAAVGVAVALGIGYLVMGEDKIERQCGLPTLPEAWYAALSIPAPTDKEGKDAGDCLPVADAKRLLSQASLASAVLPKWRDMRLDERTCTAWLLAVEDKEQGNHESIFKVCGAPPEKGLEMVEKLGSIQGGSVRILDATKIEPYAKPVEV